MEPRIAYTLRNYLSRRGRTFRPVPCYAHDIEQLRAARLLEEPLNGRVYFEGQELCVHEEPPK